MPIRLEFFPNEPILFTHYSSPLNAEADFPIALGGINKLLQDHSGVCYNVTVVGDVPMTLDMIIDGLALLRRVTGGEDRLQLLTVASDDLIQMAVRWVSQPQYGGFAPAKMVATEAEALAYIRAELAKAK